MLFFSHFTGEHEGDVEWDPCAAGEGAFLAVPVSRSGGRREQALADGKREKKELSPSPPEDKRKKNSLILG